MKRVSLNLTFVGQKKKGFLFKMYFEKNQAEIQTKKNNLQKKMGINHIHQKVDLKIDEFTSKRCKSRWGKNVHSRVLNLIDFTQTTIMKLICLNKNEIKSIWNECKDQNNDWLNRPLEGSFYHVLGPGTEVEVTPASTTST